MNTLHQTDTAPEAVDAHTAHNLSRRNFIRTATAGAVGTVLAGAILEAAEEERRIYEQHFFLRRGGNMPDGVYQDGVDNREVVFADRNHPSVFVSEYVLGGQVSGTLELSEWQPGYDVYIIPECDYGVRREERGGEYGYAQTEMYSGGNKTVNRFHGNGHNFTQHQRDMTRFVNHRYPRGVKYRAVYRPYEGDRDAVVRMSGINGLGKITNGVMVGRIRFPSERVGARKLTRNGRYMPHPLVNAESEKLFAQWQRDNGDTLPAQQ